MGFEVTDEDSYKILKVKHQKLKKTNIYIYEPVHTTEPKFLRINIQ